MLGGGGCCDTEAWFGHKFHPGQVIEGVIRDNDGQAQRTMIVEALGSISTSELRVLSLKEFDNKIPSWAFEKITATDILAYMKKRVMEPNKKRSNEVLPWVRTGVQESEEVGSDSTERAQTRRV